MIDFLDNYKSNQIKSLVIWYSTLWNAWHYGKCLTLGIGFYWFWPTCCVYPVSEGGHLLPSQLPWEHTVLLPDMAHSTCKAICHHDQPQPHIGRVRSPVVRHESDGPQVVFNVHQSHRHDSTHPSLFYQIEYHSYICGVQHSWAWSHITLWSNAGRMVIHPCINWAHVCLTSVIKHKTFTPCYVSPH